MLIHLNGLPGVGKSTLAQAYAAAHPSAVVVDVDLVRRTLPRWRDAGSASGLEARRQALATVAEELAAGRDVVVAQLVARPPYVDQLADAARSHGVRFVEVLLEASVPEAADRLRDRTAAAEHPQHLDAAEDLGPDAVGALTAYERDLTTLLAGRTDLLRLPVEGSTVDEALARLEAALRA